jgi:predicted RNA-binding protein with RPS1 domain
METLSIDLKATTDKLANGFFGGKDNKETVVSAWKKATEAPDFARSTEWNNFQKLWDEKLTTDRATLQDTIKTNKVKISELIGETVNIPNLLDKWAREGRPDEISFEGFKAVSEMVNGKNSWDTGFAPENRESYGFYGYDISNKVAEHPAEVRQFAINTLATLKALQESPALASVSKADRGFVTALHEFIKGEGDKDLNASKVLGVTEPEKIGLALREIAIARMFLEEEAKKLYDVLSLKIIFQKTSIGWQAKEMTDHVDLSLFLNELDMAKPRLGVNETGYNETNLAGALISYFAYGPGEKVE